MESTLIWEQAARLIIGTSRSLTLDDTEQIWIVERGKLDLFLQDLREDGSLSARYHIARMAEGDGVFGIDTSSYPGLKLIAGVHPGTKLFCLEMAALRPMLSSTAASDYVQLLLKRWLDHLCIAAAIQSVPKAPVTLSVGRELSVQEKEEDVVPDQDLLWVKHLRGRSRFLGNDLYIPYHGYFPLCRHGWFQTHSNSMLYAVDAQNIQLHDPDWQWLRSFHAAVIASLLLKRDIGENKTSHQLQARKESDAALMHRALMNMASPLQKERAEIAAPELTSADPFLWACQMVGKANGIKIRELPPVLRSKEIKDPVAAVANTSSVRFRRVVLKDNWWQQDGGPLLAFRESDNQAVALLPQRRKGYSLHSARHENDVKVNAKVASGLKSFAYIFYRPFPEKELGLRDLLVFGIQGSHKEIMLIILMGLTAGIVGVAPPIVTGIIFDSVIPGAERHQLFQLAALLLVTACAGALFALTRSFAVLRLEAKMDTSIQAAVWDRLLKLPIPFFRNYTSGDLANRSMGINQIRQLLTNSALSSIFSGIFSIFSFLLLFYYNSNLAGLATVLVSIAFLVSTACGYFQLQYQRKMIRIRGRTSGMLMQFINGIAKFRVSGTEIRPFAAWSREFSEQKHLSKKARQISNAATIFIAVFPIICLQAVFWYAARLIRQDGPGFLSTGDFLAFLVAFLQFLMGSLQLSSAGLSILGSVPLYERAAPILRTLPERTETKANPGELKGAIEIRHVKFRYRPETPLVLKDISFSVNPGEFVALVGSSGSGKSTLLRLLLGFESPESGTISFDGQDLSSLDIQAVRQQMGVVLQSGRLIAGSILDNIIGSLPLTMQDAWEAARLASLDKDIKAMPMGMYTFISEGGGGVSGGQRQRLMIARAIANRPRILLFDEATSALDNETQRVVSRSLEALQATRIVIAHRLSTVIHADRIFVFEKGVIVQMGTYEELMNQPGSFRELVKRQIV